MRIDKLILLVYVLIAVSALGYAITQHGKNVDIEGNLTAERVFQTDTFPHMSGVATRSMALTDSGTWYNITFNESRSHIHGGLEFIDSHNLYVWESGEYYIVYKVNIIDSSASPSANVAVGIMKNGEFFNNSYWEGVTSKQNDIQGLQQFIYMDVTAGDYLNMVIRSSANTVSVDSLGTYSPDGKRVAHGWIERID